MHLEEEKMARTKDVLVHSRYVPLHRDQTVERFATYFTCVAGLVIAVHTFVMIVQRLLRREQSLADVARLFSCKQNGEN